MKKILLGLIIGLAIGISTGIGYAWGKNTFPPSPKPIYQFNAHCPSTTNGQQSPSGEYYCNEVAVFDDAGNKCYISYDANGAQSSISCIKEPQ